MELEEKYIYGGKKMTREELKQYYLDEIEKAQTAEEKKLYTDCFIALEKNEIQAEKNAADYELAKDKSENEVSIETYKVDKEAEIEEKSILQRAKAATLEHWTKFAGVVGAAVAVEVIRGLVKKYVLKEVIYAEKHDDLYINGNKYNDRQF